MMHIKFIDQSYLNLVLRLKNFPINMQHFPNGMVNDVCRTRKLVWNQYRMSIELTTTTKKKKDVF